MRKILGIIGCVMAMAGGGCATQELVATREGMAAADVTIHRDYIARVNADPGETPAGKAAAEAVVGEYDTILAESRASFPATQP